MLESQLINCCAPTLASLKAGSLFSCSCACGSECIESHIDKWNRDFEQAGIRIIMLRKTDSSALIYVYRVSALGKALSDPGVRGFLSSLGYKCCENCCSECAPEHCIEACLRHLKKRIMSCECLENMKFPHEIGIFLDYPLEDVREFICNGGRNCKFTGVWKVYGDEERARDRFQKYKKCNDVYSRLWRSGKRSITQLTVAG